MPNQITGNKRSRDIATRLGLSGDDEFRWEISLRCENHVLSTFAAFFFVTRVTDVLGSSYAES